MAGTDQLIGTAHGVYPTSGAVHGIPGVQYTFGGRASGNVSVQVGERDSGAPARLAATVGLDASRAVRMRQVHGRDVAHATATHAGGWIPGTADAMVTAEPGLGLMVSTADCVPLLLAAPNGVAAAHAGRDGVLLDIATATVAQLQRTAGDTPDQMVALIGPSIGGCCYEVDAALQSQAVAQVPATAATTTWGTPALELPGAVETQLAAAGVRRIHRAGGCTLCGADRWFSHRATTNHGATAGRQAAIIVRNPSDDMAVVPPRPDATGSLD